MAKFRVTITQTTSREYTIDALDEQTARVWIEDEYFDSPREHANVVVDDYGYDDNSVSFGVQEVR